MVDGKNGYIRIQNKGADAAEIRKRENQMKADLDEFRNNICKALLFINMCFFVFSVTMKAYADDLPKFSLPLPITFLSWGQYDSFFDWQRAQIDVSSVSPIVFDMLNEAEKQVAGATNRTDIIRSLAASLLSEEDYKLQCSDYFNDIRNGFNIF